MDAYRRRCCPAAAVALLLCLSLATAVPFDLKTVSFDEAYTPLFGDSNVVKSAAGDGVRLLLDRYTGSGFISSNMYNYGFFSANLKLPGNYTAGIVVAFYMSNNDVFEKMHDELDIEFLGNVKGKPWRFQTNLYGNGSTNRGREERYTLWFDPTKASHRYSILWSAHNIIFYVDDVPIREVMHSSAMGSDYPAKPMSLYATIWDASTWATSGGKYKVNYRYAPFVAEFTDLAIHGCVADPIQQLPGAAARCAEEEAELEAKNYAVVTRARRKAMAKFRQRYMYYSYCYDTLRYPVPPPECVIEPDLKKRFKDTGRLKFGASHRRRSRRRSHVAAQTLAEDEAAL